MSLGRAKRFLTTLAVCAALGGPPAVAAQEAYVSLERMRVPVESGSGTRFLVVEIDLALASAVDRERFRAVQKQVGQAVAQALAARPIDEFEGGNLALTVKRVARGAAQRAAGSEIRVSDALIRDVRLM